MLYASIAVLALLLILAFWYKTTFLFMFAGLVALAFAGWWISKADGVFFYVAEGIIVGLVGAYNLIKAGIPPYTW